MAYARPVLCRLCGFPASDGGVPVSQVDREKLSEWCLRVMDTELDQEGLDDAVFCLFCVRQARFLDENCDLPEKRSLPIWWKRCDVLGRSANNFLIDDIIQQCAVTIPGIPKDLQQKYGLIEDNNGTNQNQTQRSGRCIISICIYCSAQLESRRALFRHVEEEHQNDVTFRCSICTQFFLSSQDKNDHLEKFHRGLKLKCPYCFKHSTGKDALSAHVKKAHSRKLICCPYRCSAYFANDKMRTEHIREVHETEEKIRCIYCEKHIPKDNVLGHMNRHHKSIYVKCNFLKNCPTFFHTEEEREKHILEVHESPFVRMKCIYCKRRILKAVITTHVKGEHPKERIKCSYFSCITYFHTQEEKQKHIQEVHEKDNNYRCIYCQKMIRNSRSTQSIISHMHSRHKKEVIKCDYLGSCPTYFLTQEDKQKHILEVHESGEDKIRCKFCSRKVRIEGMKGHIRACHWSESKGLGITFERVKCIYCKSQMKKMWLASHIKLFHKTEAIRCNFSKNCSTYFLTVEGRQKHLEQVHLSGKQGKEFNCCICKAIYTSRDSLKYHVNKNHPHLVQCIMHGCGEYFLSEQERDEHFEEVHSLQEKGKIFRCSHCRFVALSREDREIHSAQAHAEATIQCLKCPKMVKSKSALRGHVSSVHGEKRQCPHCQNQISVLKWRLHLQETSCPTCKSPFLCRGIRAKHPRSCIRNF